MWSDESGLKECTKGNTHPPSPQWSWVGTPIPIQPAPSQMILESHQQIFDPKTVSQVSEWAVDAGVPGGTDKEGWQYAADFPAYVTAAAQNQQGWNRGQCNVGPCFLQQNFPRTQNLEGLCET